jgi:hypothetical protein
MVFKADSEGAEVSAIKQVIGRQFRSLSWNREKDADWNGFANTFLPGASLFPAARPVQPRTVDQFVERMKRLRTEGKLGTFEETPLGCKVHVFGNVAVAFAACEMLENGSTVTRDVSATILVRDNDVWRIAAQAWDIESEACKIPADLAERKSAVAQLPRRASVKRRRQKKKDAGPDNAFEGGGANKRRPAQRGR